MNYYKIDLLDPATPSFITSIIPYVGTKKEIETFVANGNMYEELKEWCKDNLDTKEDLFIPKEIEKIKIKDFHDKEEKYFTHMNVWECGYEMYYKELEGKFLYYSLNGKFYRAFYVDAIVGLSYVISGEEMRLYSNLPENIDKVYHALSNDGWGNKNIICMDNPMGEKHYFAKKENLQHVLNSILGYTDKCFENEAEMLEDIKNPAPCKLELFINDYFADG